MMRSNLSTFAIAGVLSLSAASLAACGGPPEGAASPAAAASPSAPAPAGDVKELGDAKVGDKAKCPVSGEEFTVEASSPKSELEGKTYYFCCSGCKKKFDAEPAKYLKKS